MSVTVTSPDVVPLHLDAAPSAEARRPRTQLVATALVAAGSAIAFAGVLGAYLSVRAEVLASGESWLPDGSTIPLSPGNMGMVTLSMTLVTVLWASYSGRKGDRPHAYQALGLTILLGLAHLVQIAFLWTQWNLPLNGAPTPQAVLLFTLVGMHVAMIGAGLIYLALMTVRSLGGQLTGPDAEGLSAAALYWYVTVGVYSVLWYAVLITK